MDLAGLGQKRSIAIATMALTTRDNRKVLKPNADFMKGGDAIICKVSMKTLV